MRRRRRGAWYKYLIVWQAALWVLIVLALAAWIAYGPEMQW